MNVEIQQSAQYRVGLSCTQRGLADYRAGEIALKPDCHTRVLAKFDRAVEMRGGGWSGEVF